MFRLLLFSKHRLSCARASYPRARAGALCHESSAMPLVYLPELEVFFVWGEVTSPRELPWLARGGEATRVELVVPQGRRVVDGRKLPLFDTTAKLAVVPAAALDRVPGSIATWILASKLAIELVSRACVVPTIARRGGRIEARWAAALAASEDASRVAALARSMSPAAHAIPRSAAAVREVWAPDALLRAYLDAAVDGLVRPAKGGPELRTGSPASAIRRSPAIAR